jgi:hypothetical protein
VKWGVLGNTTDVVKSQGKLVEIARGPGEGGKFVVERVGAERIGAEIEDFEMDLEV